jgi:hypothetical protein
MPRMPVPARAFRLWKICQVVIVRDRNPSYCPTMKGQNEQEFLAHLSPDVKYAAGHIFTADNLRAYIHLKRRRKIRFGQDTTFLNSLCSQSNGEHFQALHRQDKAHRSFQDLRRNYRLQVLLLPVKKLQSVQT